MTVGAVAATCLASPKSKYLFSELHAMYPSAGPCSLRQWLLFVAVLLASQLLVSSAFADDDGLVVGSIDWAPNIPFSQKTEWDKTNYWAAIAISPSTGKYAASCEWTSEVNATRQAREKCSATDARAVVLCCNGWCALALGTREAGKDIAWGVGWGPNQSAAERHALEAARDRKLPDAKVVYSINSREMRTGGAIAYSESTGDWGYATGGARSSAYKAPQHCKAADAKVIAQQSDCWMALALGDDKGVYGWGHAGTAPTPKALPWRAAASRTKNVKIVLSFCTNGVEY